MKMSAIISDCGKYRYELRRVWDSSKPWVLFICLNPATADGEKDDQTSRVCEGYVRRWDRTKHLIGGGYVIANLFAYRSTNPDELPLDINLKVGSENDKHLARLITGAAEVVCAWGDHNSIKTRDRAVLSMIQKPMCLTILKSGRPGHPLFKPKDLTPTPL